MVKDYFQNPEIILAFGTGFSRMEYTARARLGT